MGSGVAGAIKRRGGSSIEREAVSKGPVPVGTAVVTSAGDLPARHVIHGAVMGQDLRTDLSIVAETTRSVLDLAKGMAITSLAMPLLGTGVGGLALGEVATTMAGVVSEVASEGRGRGLEVSLVGYDEAASAAILRAVGSL
ncbi:MAG: Appr-1-p processing protein [Thermoplasmata archaeon]|nr:Appr-1-p processing protein [Thermoplasmata archaeon]NIS12614.1 Appr-1-p processing protein [Thermoplasmata archaeon]NIS21290.1 Appr-1-p processing protein [Thermoplasmata archaeon]NIT77914.1 Appr-1-p processing protein [Thermoplasmata archaeon]NIU50343.1 Appr-1-p processing protein [Thermoplasmata archaeon]